MAAVVSFINMKGGVGKTTLAMQIAFAAGIRGLRALAIDLDPQSNLSQSLMGDQPYIQHLRDNKPTITQIFDGFAAPSKLHRAPQRVNLDDTVVKHSGLKNQFAPDLIPSRLLLARNLKNVSGKERRLAEAISQFEERYDLIVIDCPPTESILTDAAYAASRYLCVPVKPEFLGAIGLPLLAASIDEFRLKNPDHEVDICGLAFNFSPTEKRIGPEARGSIVEIEGIARKHRWRIYSTHIPFSRSYARATRYSSPIGSTPNVRTPVRQKFKQFAKQFFISFGIET
jgi:chromosome partitioning protein